MKKGLVILFIFSLLLLLSNCNSFQMLGEDDFDVKEEEPVPDVDPNPEVNVNTQPEKAPSVEVTQVSYDVYPSYFNVGDFDENRMNVEINYEPKSNVQYQTVNFGRISSGRTAYVTFEIKNTGNDYLVLEDDPPIYIQSVCWFDAHRSPQNLIRPGESTRFTLKNIINTPGYYESMIYFTSNAPLKRRFYFKVKLLLY